METARIIQILAVVVFTFVAAVWDTRTKKIPNRLTVPAFCLALAYHAVAGFATAGFAGMGERLLFALAGFGTGFGILLVLFLIGGGGAGDVKMMGALGAWLGAYDTLFVFLVSALLALFGSGLILTVEVLSKNFGYVRRRYFQRRADEQGSLSEERSKTNATRNRERRRIMPYGVPVALATWLVLAYVELISKT